MCASGPAIPTLLLDLINPYHPSPWSQFPFFSPYLLLHPPQSPLASTERLPRRVEALIQGWEVWYSPSHSLSICALFVTRGLYRSRNSSLPSDPISDLNILAVPPCKCRDGKSCPFTNALHPSISYQQPPPPPLCDTGLQPNSNSAEQYQESVTSFMPTTILASLYLFVGPSLAPLAPCLT